MTASLIVSYRGSAAWRASCTDMRLTMMVLMLAGTSVVADTEIHRCSLEDGTIAFQEKPCLDPADDADDKSEADDSRSDSGSPGANDDAFDFVNPFDEPASPPMPSEPTSPGPASKDRAECEKTTRDAIDAIDLELQQQAATKEPSREHLAELLALTQQLRACKRL
ncbi:MAG: hypothetical protein GY949_00055 [Gammaproteobacteria bacterium]|nr:hypothetical protein [Gammaproteobacteria bacterium]